jgi:LmbE family N-acetylglucosaminyl deacetylase
VQIVHVTEGSPPGTSDAVAAGFATQAEYALARVAEARCALALAGVEANAIRNLRLTDQRVSFCLGELIDKIVRTIGRENPEILLTHAYEGGHPDHDSVAFACHVAHEVNIRKRGCSGLRLMEFAGYHGEGGAIRTYGFVSCSDSWEIRHDLNHEEESLKKEMLERFKTQSKTLQAFLPPRVERYRDAPKYDFASPPHRGKLFYEHFDWGMDGATWRGFAQAALRELKPPRRKS